jgi:RNA polymerase subunit RPABC4/transcription elongation factor Spt4
VNRSSHFLQVDNNNCSETCPKVGESTATTENWQGKIACIKSWLTEMGCDFKSAISVNYKITGKKAET